MSVSALPLSHPFKILHLQKCLLGLGKRTLRIHKGKHVVHMLLVPWIPQPGFSAAFCQWDITVQALHTERRRPGETKPSYTGFSFSHRGILDASQHQAEG